MQLHYTDEQGLDHTEWLPPATLNPYYMQRTHLEPRALTQLAISRGDYELHSSLIRDGHHRVVGIQAYLWRTEGQRGDRYRLAYFADNDGLARLWAHWIAHIEATGWPVPDYSPWYNAELHPYYTHLVGGHQENLQVSLRLDGLRLNLMRRERYGGAQGGTEGVVWRAHPPRGITGATVELATNLARGDDGLDALYDHWLERLETDGMPTLADQEAWILAENPMWEAWRKELSAVVRHWRDSPRDLAAIEAFAGPIFPEHAQERIAQMTFGGSFADLVAAPAPAPKRQRAKRPKQRISQVQEVWF